LISPVAGVKVNTQYELAEIISHRAPKLLNPPSRHDHQLTFFIFSYQKNLEIRGPSLVDVVFQDGGLARIAAAPLLSSARNPGPSTARASIIFNGRGGGFGPRKDEHQRAESVAEAMRPFGIQRDPDIVAAIFNAALLLDLRLRD